MKVSELKPGQGKVDVQLLVKSVSDVRSVNSYGKELRVANAVGSDDSGEIKISLWNDDITKVNTGDTIKITNGYVSEFNGERQLSAGKFGKIETVSPNGVAPATSVSAKEAKTVKPAAAKATPAPDSSKKPVKKEEFDEEKEKAIEGDEEDSKEEMNYEEKEF